MNNVSIIERKAINLVWLKRDLRLSDHQPLASSVESGLTLLYYVFEPCLVNDPHYDLRHWRFVWQSIQDLNQQLAAFNSQVYVFFGDAVAALDEIQKQFIIKQLFSHEETGLLVTFERDKQIKSWCNRHKVQWHETPTGAVVRARKDRQGWDKQWRKVIKGELTSPKLSTHNLVPNKALIALPQATLPDDWLIMDPSMLTGGEQWAHKILNSFLGGRGKHYHFNISKPLASRKSCSRLSPYLAWGNISLKQCYQAILQKRPEFGWKKTIDGLASRLHWHCHFIQKFESEHQMQWRHLNAAYHHFDYPEQHCGLSVTTRLARWKNAQTGYPLVDACMLCLMKTGYINFRMRAMLVSFLCHHLLVDWRLGVTYLAKLFLDFEPGIHYPQFQMQSGVTGTNIIRVYNPVKQSQEKDPDGDFIRKWLPQLSDIPNEIIHTPWILSAMEQQLYQFTIGESYPEPMVDIEQTGKIARDLLWSFRKRIDTRQEGQRIVAKHVRKRRPRSSKSKQ
ncbi:deoxyribodipyrimidine photo-lyase/cryptochrome family protein [Psychromonas sp.]|uniref:cryptochrome/deoxyribodipyrimidine photo-lyase family protein n=1 Tax=Psychromonas sp. TaxID=1884585 RepID=UPI003A980001